MTTTRTSITKSRAGHYIATVRSTEMGYTAYFTQGDKQSNVDRARQDVPALIALVNERVAALKLQRSIGAA